ncbi:MAG: competence protein CoiA family protein [Kiloniellales bacterium]|nr:competence protein CoiA family protein [Kiloniellales bacterium]
MLVAALKGDRVEADIAERGLEYLCPECKGPVILKRGRIKIAHFAHKPPTDCTWAKGETLAHLESKKLFRDSFVSRGLRAEVEFLVPSLPNDRRADVLVWSPMGQQAAIELQHTSIQPEVIEKRAFSYAREGIAQAWIPFLSPKAMVQAETGKGSGGLFIERYSARPFERWAHAFHFGRLWFYNPTQKVLWRGHFDDHQIWVDHSDWYSSDGEEMSAGGYSRISKRWKELTLWGPYSVDQVKIKIRQRKAWQTDRYRIPAGRVAHFVTEDEPDS